MRLLLAYCLIFQCSLLAKSFSGDGRSPAQFEGSGELYYNQCISTLYNHPHFLKSSGGIQMGDQQKLMKELDDYCICHSKEDVRQHILSKKLKIAFFFINKKNYLAGLDICLQEKVSIENRREFFEIMSTIKIAPILNQDLMAVLPSSLQQMTSHKKNGPSKHCIERELVKACEENSSLYFLFRCFKRKIKDSGFFDRSYAVCS